MILPALSAVWTSVATQMANHLWQSSLFVVVVGILAFALRKNQARIRYWIWLTASIKFLIPFSLLIAIGSHLAKPRASTPAQAVVYSSVENLSQPFAEQGLPVIYQATPSRAQATLLLRPMMVAVWLGGIVFVLVRWVTGWFRVLLMVRRAVSLGEGPEVDALRRLESSSGIRKPTRLVLSRNCMEPGIFGIFRPVLIWPDGISQHLDDRHIEAVLAHEIYHAHRRDNLTAVLHMLVETIFWFHPLVWWVGAKLEEERERACDEYVSQLFRQPQVYAESILRVCKYCSESPLACVSGITGADLKKRVMQIMTGSVALKLDLSRKLLLLIVALATVAVPIVLGQARVAQLYSTLDLRAAGLRATPHSFAPIDDRFLSIPRHAPLESLLQVASSVQTVNNGTVGAPGMPDWQKAAGGTMEFEVASIHPSKPGEFTPPNFPISNDDSYTAGPNDSFIADFSLEAYIEFAYKLRLSADQRKALLAGAPQWVSNDNYEIRAKASSPVTKDQLRLMMQALLADRFKLSIHFETRDTPILALVLTQPGKLGPKLIPHSQGPSCNLPSETFPYSCESYGFMRTPTHMFMEGSRDTTLGLLAASLTSLPGVFLTNTVIDRTGLSGRYDFTLEWTPESNSPLGSEAGVQSDPQGPAFVEALKEQLGLKLESTRGLQELPIINHAERPSEN